ncbi:MAG TPA: hypothetical protein VHM90_13510, partial [Phycisphaerae bacterium]|nr:hypothetical protein [Phycisphaerae bacterium]
DDKELERRDVQSVGGLAVTQGGLVDQIDTLNKDERLGQVAVVVWMNGEVADSMKTSKSRLEKQQLTKPTTVAQQAAIDRLQLIIDALKEEQNKPPEFNDGGGGGGGGGGGPKPLVPPLAQLKLLKAMQLVVNTQTREVDGDLKSAGNDADRNAFQTQAQELGGKETKIRGMASDIADQLMRNQRRPAPGPAATGPGGAPTSQPGPR